ncbi:Rho guanine nucleotide exchange factor 5 [Merluccius polli]|uniref:Rho guanine nucleotide exchange factor 5 n=1 Tax=Merluccius polli TaxID=89951 RepID=A0AA47NST0_MERPO|nr:Rho guanine nucleotide exchange factor 5 [Merluccius polli]
MALECVLGVCVLMPHLEDLLLRRGPSFRAVYVPYLSNMMFQEALFNKLQQENKRFAPAVKTLESDPICQRRSLKSFLGLPFQRITRLKLLMENVLRLTDPDADLYLNLKKTIEALHKVIMECNEGVKRMKQTEELVCLEMLLDFSNVKGRFLLHEGPLRRLTEVGADLKISFIDVYLHLFNDLVVILRRKVLDYASFPTGVRVEQLNASSTLGLPADAVLLHLSQNHAGQATAPSQAVEEVGYVSEPIAGLGPCAQDRETPPLLELHHFPLGHVAVHEQVKSQAVKEGAEVFP